MKALFNAFESQNTLAETQKQLGNYRIRELAVGAGTLLCPVPDGISCLRSDACTPVFPPEKKTPNMSQASDRPS